MSLPESREFQAAIFRVQRLLDESPGAPDHRTWARICRAANVTPAASFPETVRRVQTAIRVPENRRDGIAGIETWLTLEHFLVSQAAKKKKPSILHPIQRTKFNMTQKLAQVVGSLIRTWLAFGGGFLVSKGVLTTEQADQAVGAFGAGFDTVIAGVAAVAVAQVWSVVQKKIIKPQQEDDE